MTSSKHQGQGAGHGGSASVNVQVHDGSGDNLSLQMSSGDDLGVQLNDGSGDKINVQVHDGSSDDITVHMRDKAGDDISVKLHDGSSDDVSVRMHDQSGDDISVKLHAGSGDSVSLHLHDGSGDDVSLQLHGDDVSLHVHDGSGDDVSVRVDDGDDPPCYCRGTLIRTPRRELRVEDLTIGDLVTTISGEAKSIKWIGRRSYAGRFIAGKHDVLPIVVRAGALAPDVPVRDLWLSPGHALLLDGVLVQAEHLLNGLTILQAEAVDQVEYFHLEFEGHEVIFAEGAPAESYVECYNRQGFQNAHEFAELYPDDARPSFSYCLPRVEAGTAELAAIRARLFERAAALGHPTTADPDLHLVVDGTIVAAQSVTDRRYSFRLGKAADEVWLASRCGVPAQMNLLSKDRRCLGVCVQRLVMRDEHLRLEISHSHPALSEGFHDDEEGARRWTAGMGRVPEKFLHAFADGFTIEVHCLPPMQRYPLQPQNVAVPEQVARSAAAPRQVARSRSRKSAAKGRATRPAGRLLTRAATV